MSATIPVLAHAAWAYLPELTVILKFATTVLELCRTVRRRAETRGRGCRQRTPRRATTR